MIVLEMTVNGASIPCKHPTRRMMRRIRTNYFKNIRTRLHDSFGLLTIQNQKDSGQYNPYKDLHRKSRRSISVDPTEERCPTNLEHVRDSCPHFYVLDVDNKRIPKIIIQAKCKCLKCLNFDQLNQPNEFNDTYMSCIPVNYYSRVLRVKGCTADGFHKYVETWEPVAVGCSCANRRPRTINHK